MIDHKKELCELINYIQLRRPGAFVDPEDTSELNLRLTIEGIKREMQLAGSEDAYAPSRIVDGKTIEPPKKFYFAMCMAQTSRGGGMTEIFIDEHPLMWIERKREEMRSEGIRGIMVIQFFSEIPYEVYRHAKEAEKKQIITPPEKKLVIPG